MSEYEYMEAEGCCPLCGNIEIEWNGDDNDGFYLIYRGSCPKCGTEFYDVNKIEFFRKEIIKEGVLK